MTTFKSKSQTDSLLLTGETLGASPGSSKTRLFQGLCRPLKRTRLVRLPLSCGMAKAQIRRT